MIIGLDFDNTMVRYDALFHQCASERGLVDQSVPATKLAVRDHLRRQGREGVWTDLQGEVYGPRMHLAKASEGLVEVLQWARGEGHTCTVISHRSRRPYSGPAHDLHASATAWIAANLNAGSAPLISPDRVTFHETKAAKIAHIAASGCDVFIDDLPEILKAELFPARTRRLLFDPDGDHTNSCDLESVRDWRSIQILLSG